MGFWIGFWYSECWYSCVFNIGVFTFLYYSNFYLFLMTNQKSKGTRHFILQRITALINILVGVPILFFFLANIGEPYIQVKQLFRQLFLWLPLLFLMLSISYHMWIGINHMLDDYIDARRLHNFLRFLNSTYVCIFALLSCFVIIKLGIL